MTTAQAELIGYDLAADLTWRMRRLVLARDGYGCICCDRSVLSRPYAIHMRKPRYLGGVVSPENLITVLQECGDRISLQCDPADEARGYVLSAWDEPAIVPVAYTTPAGQARAWLSPDGRRSFAQRPEALDSV